MNHEEFIDLSKRMVVEYYNRYVHNNDEPEYANIKADQSLIDILEEEIDGDGIMKVTLQVVIHLWLEYHVEYNPNAIGNNKISSFITLS